MSSLVKRNLLIYIIKSYVVFKGRNKGRNDIVKPHNLYIQFTETGITDNVLPLKSVWCCKPNVDIMLHSL